MFILIGHYCDWWQDWVWTGCITWEGLSSESSAVAKWVVLARQLLRTLQLPVGPHVFGIAAFICIHIHSNATIYVALFRRLDMSPEKWRHTHTSWSMNQKVSSLWNSLTCYEIKLHLSDIDCVPCVISFCMNNHLVNVQSEWMYVLCINASIEVGAQQTLRFLFIIICWLQCSSNVLSRTWIRWHFLCVCRLCCRQVACEEDG